MLNLFKALFLISITFIGCGAPAGRTGYLTKTDGRGKIRYKTVAELQDTLAAWNYPNAMALKMPDSVRANFPHMFKMYLLNDKLEVLHEVCEAYFPGLEKNVDLADQRWFNPPDRYVKSLLEHSTTVDDRELLKVIRENTAEHPVQVIVVMGFYKKELFDDRMEELSTLFEGNLPPVYSVHTLRFFDGDLSESEFLTIQYKWFEENREKLPQEAYDRLDSIRRAERSM